MTAHVDDVIHATSDPVEAVSGAVSAVAREVISCNTTNACTL